LNAQAFDRRPVARLAALLLALLSALAAVPAPAQTGEQSLREFRQGLRSLRADFHQVRYDEHSEVLEEADGTLLLLLPNRFRWDYHSPYPQAIVSDGARLWWYDSELEQVTVRPVDEALETSPAQLLSSDEPLTANFIVREEASDGALAWVSLTPKNPESSFQEVRLGFGSGNLQAMELLDSFDQLTQIGFEQVSRNPHLDPGLFAFTPPPGTDVMSEP